MVCKKCHLDKSDFFWKRTRSGKTTLHRQCSDCMGLAQKKRYDANPDYYINITKRRQRQLRQQVVEAYGGKCVCCGESNPIFLAIDHVNNDGHTHRVKGKHFGPKLYLIIVKQNFPSHYQLLCYNCNMGKHLNGGTCPHQNEPSAT